MIKKILLLINITFIITILIDINKVEANDEIPQVSTDQYEQNIADTINTSSENLMNKVNNKESFILYIGYPECKYCRAFSETLKEFIKKDNAEVYYLNIDNINNKTISNSLNSFLFNDLELEGTPTIAYINKGIVNQDLNYSGYGFNIEDLELMLN